MGHIHTTFAKGKRLIIKLKNGTVFIDHWIERRSKFIKFRKQGKIKVKDIRFISYYKEAEK